MLTVNELAEAGLTQRDVQLRVVCLASVWLEGLLYGVYLCLFIAVFPVLARSNPFRNSSTAVFVVGNVLIFVLISIFNATSIFTPIIAFAYQTEIEGTRRIFYDLGLWVNSLQLVLGVMLFITGDILVIYRCFLIWGRCYRVILLPSVLSALAAALHIATLWFALHISLPFVLVRNWAIITLPFILYFLQNVLTTSLIVYKIYSHFRRSREIGLVSVHTPHLLPIIKIVIESAAIYTAAVLVLVVLIALDHPARTAMHTCLMPIIGIVFVLMALRTHAVKEDSKQIPPTASLMPTWLGFDEPKSTDPGIETV
ncbi:hypothetical protein BKA70DRAFT_1410641 [Coprinopsis sp. MPI-PUGE-AT-0042]|nr:hypothetical protein BKA70DRAFT_1410641 [Coprinopsis sp. MPI-PUGE-AT-0042]